MKTLETLIKLNKRELDERRKELVEAEETLDRLIKVLALHRNTMKNEAEHAAKSVEGLYNYENYLNYSLDREKKIIELIKHQEKKVAEIRDKIFEIFTELKKFEIVRDIRIAEEKKQEDRRETAMLDEIAINRFLINQIEESGEETNDNR